MKTLAEFNAERRPAPSSYPKPNDIACPKWGAGLLDTYPWVLASNPPQKNVHCARCDFTGLRLL